MAVRWACENAFAQRFDMRLERVRSLAGSFCHDGRAGRGSAGILVSLSVDVEVEDKRVGADQNVGQAPNLSTVTLGAGRIWIDESALRSIERNS